MTGGLKFVGFCIAGGALMLMAEVAPGFAVTTFGLIVLGELLINPSLFDELTVLVGGKVVAPGTPSIIGTVGNKT